MRAARFLERRSPVWERVEELVRAGQGGLRRLSDDELHELIRLYPSVAVDVARARMLGLPQETQRRLNLLAVGAHGLLYNPPRARPLRPVLRFLGRGYPRLFRRLWPYVLASVLIAFFAGFGAYTSTRLQPSNVYLCVPGFVMFSEDRDIVSAEDISERFRQMPHPPMAAGIITNNISVAFNAFAAGITAGIGTCYLLLFNGMMLGGLAAHFANHGLSYPFWSFIMPHGVLEIMAILIAGAAGLRMGLSLAMPGNLSRLSSLQAGAKEALLLVLGTIPMFVIAGTIEGFLTPSYLPGGAKIAVGLVAGGSVAAYLLLGGRRAQAATVAPET